MSDTNGQQGTKRKSGEEYVTERLDRLTKSSKSTNISTLPEQEGPLYPKLDNSIVLYENLENCWDETNPNGIVPVIVHPDLVSGIGGGLQEKQIEGIKFLWNCFNERKGGILAHGTGLGKTRTGVTLVATLLQQSANRNAKSQPAITKCLIIAPKNGVSVWKDEFDKWCPQEIPCHIDVVKPNQKDGWEVVNRFKSPNSSTNILILSYDSFLKYNASYDTGFKGYPVHAIDLVICDEAHVLKNCTTARVKTFQGFENKAKLWLGFTATPYQNNVEELCNLVGFFRNAAFDGIDYKRLCKDIMSTLKKSSKLSRDSKSKLDILKEKIKPVLDYRHNFLGVEKHEITLCVPLGGHPNYARDDDPYSPQHELYRQLTEQFGSPNYKEVTFYEQLSHLTKACIAPETCYQAISKKPNVFQPIIDWYDTKITPKFRSIPQFEIALSCDSAKIKMVTDMAKFLKENRRDEKMVIASGSVVLLKLIKNIFKTNRYKVVVYDGETSESERDRSLRAFEENDEVSFLLLSIKAGGTALTLVRANHLVLMDPDYNPANDKQVLGRLYRPGQTRSVYLYRILCTGTIEEVKYINQLGKEEVDKYIRSEGQGDIQVPFSETDLIKYSPEDRSFIRKILDKLEIENFNSELMDRAFAEELKAAKQYSKAHELPDKLDLLKNVWDSVSYAFHIETIPDEVSQILAIGEI